MENEHPLVRDVFPELADELVALLEGEGEAQLALGVRELRVAEVCGCDDDFCQSFRTVPHRAGQPYGAGHRVELPAAEGMVVLDVVGDQVVYVELIDRAPMRDTRVRGTAV
ncbi:hypothetical protein ACFV4P_23125 [Kitasatospora sp. NPDC059795]|uniref:hypothetical protein n=1 Tax=Kitasatospora sp. NPDC059795 TaxID=3346949 RepID=UPI003665CDBA